MPQNAACTINNTALRSSVCDRRRATCSQYHSWFRYEAFGSLQQPAASAEYFIIENHIKLYILYGELAFLVFMYETTA